MLLFFCGFEVLLAASLESRHLNGCCITKSVVGNEMTESWEIQATLIFEPPDRVIVQAMAPQNSPWFRGHFPGQPILPAIGLLSLVMKALRYFGEQQDLKLQDLGVRKARFTLPIRPGDNFEILLQSRISEEKLVSTFKVLLKEQMAGNGIMVAGLRGLDTESQ